MNLKLWLGYVRIRKWIKNVYVVVVEWLKKIRDLYMDTTKDTHNLTPKNQNERLSKNNKSGIKHKIFKNLEKDSQPTVSPQKHFLKKVTSRIGKLSVSFDRFKTGVDIGTGVEESLLKSKGFVTVKNIEIGEKGFLKRITTPAKSAKRKEVI